MQRFLWFMGCLALMALGGCAYLPQIGHQPMYHNPFPQLTKVAIAPFFNLSTEPAVDGRQFAEAYGNELQLIPGFEVVPVGVVERAMEAHGLSLESPEQARKLAQQLGVDAIVVAAVTDYRPYYPPRCGLQIEWYAANPFFHPIPMGYGLPWGTVEEKEIPAPVVMETEMNLAREQLKTQTPPYEPEPGADGPVLPPGSAPGELMPSDEIPPHPDSEADTISYKRGKDCPVGEGAKVEATGAIGIGEPGATAAETAIPPAWPDARGLFPPPPAGRQGLLSPCNEPVLRHTRIYDGADGEFTTSLSNYYFFRSDERGSSWHGYLVRMPDFIRFCCYRHITEMISARGGIDEARVVWRWPPSR